MELSQHVQIMLPLPNAMMGLRLQPKNLVLIKACQSVLKVSQALVLMAVIQSLKKKNRSLLLMRMVENKKLLPQSNLEPQSVLMELGHCAQVMSNQHKPKMVQHVMIKKLHQSVKMELISQDLLKQKLLKLEHPHVLMVKHQLVLMINPRLNALMLLYAMLEIQYVLIYYLQRSVLMDLEQLNR